MADVFFPSFSEFLCQMKNGEIFSNMICHCRIYGNGVKHCDGHGNEGRARRLIKPIFSVDCRVH